MAQVLIVKLPQLLEIVKLKNITRRVHLEVHGRQNIQIILHHPLPEERIVPADGSVCLCQCNKRIGEFLFPKGMTQKNLPAGAAFLHFENPAVGIRVNVHFVGHIRNGDTGVEGLVLKLMERILYKIAVADTDIGIAKLLPGKVQTLDVVLQIKGIVDDEANAVLVFQVEEHFLFISQHQRNILDTRRLKLLDLAFNQPLPLDLKQPLGLLQRQRDKPGGGSRRQNHRVVHPVWLQRLQSRRCQASGLGDHAIPNQPVVCFPICQGSVFLDIRAANRPAPASVIQAVQNVKFRFCHSIPSFMPWRGKSSPAVSLS